MMAVILFTLMLLVWLSLAVYQDDAIVGCLMLATAPIIFALLFALALLVMASTLGRKRIRFQILDVEVAA